MCSQLSQSELSDIVGNSCNTLKQRGAVHHGDTVPCFMEPSCIVWTNLKSNSLKSANSTYLRPLTALRVPASLEGIPLIKDEPNALGSNFPGAELALKYESKKPATVRVLFDCLAEQKAFWKPSDKTCCVWITSHSVKENGNMCHITISLWFQRRVFSTFDENSWI